MRHPPLDRRIIEWERRLLALHGDEPFMDRGFDIAMSLRRREGRLNIEQLLRLRDRYGATYYVAKGERPDLSPYRLFSADQLSVYDLSRLQP